MDGFEIFFTILAAVSFIGVLITRSERYQRWVDGEDSYATTKKQ